MGAIADGGESTVRTGAEQPPRRTNLSGRFSALLSSGAFRLILSLAIVLLALGAGWSLRTSAGFGTVGSAPEVGKVAPDFASVDLDGDEIRLSDYRGRGVVVNFFASWCKPCEEEMPVIAGMAAGAEDYSVVGVAVRDDLAATRRFLERHDAGIRAADDGDGTIMRTYRLIGPPATFFIDADGVVQHVVFGALDSAGAAEGLDAMATGAGTSSNPALTFGLGALVLAFFAGLLSFVSPCVIPLVPAYLLYITGTSLDSRTGEVSARPGRVLVHTTAFIVGLAVVLALMGGSASAVGSVLFSYQRVFAYVAGAFVVVFGVSMMGLLPLRALATERRLDFTRFRGRGLVGSLLIGAAFAVGWTPCIGPFLGALLALSAQAETVRGGMLLLFAYALGLGAPFLVVGMLSTTGMRLTPRIARHGHAISLMSGALLVVLGVLLFSGRLAELAQRSTSMFGTGLTG